MVNDQICRHNPPVNTKQGPANLTKRQENFDQIHAENRVKQSGVCINRKKYNKYYFGGGASDKSKSLLRPSFRP